jgi:hypothetical protein
VVPGRVVAKNRISKNKWLAITIIIAISGLCLISNNYLRSLFFQGAYRYNYFCSEGGKNCLTVITFYKPGIGDTPFKRYVVLGKKKPKIPLKERYIEYPNDTGLVILWESDFKCKIISNQPVTKAMELSKDINVQFIYSNKTYEEYAVKFPNFTL